MKFPIFETISKISNGVKAVKETTMSIWQQLAALKDFVLNYNSSKDMEWQIAHPLPGSEQPDWKQIAAYFSRGAALGCELVEATGKFCAEQFAKKGQ